MYAELPILPLDASTVEILRRGTPRQQAAYECVASRKFLSILAPMRAVLASTIALGIDTSESDLDVLCHIANLDHFSSFISEKWGRFPNFHEVSTSTPSQSRCCAFRCDGFAVEIYGSLHSLEQQFGFKHYVVTARLLKIAGEPLRDKLWHLKQQGYKTEPAIAKLLALSGDPYVSVAALIERDDSELGALVATMAKEVSVSDYIGCIILESLIDQTVMSETIVEESKDCAAPPGDSFTVWRQRLIRISRDKADDFAHRLCRSMGPHFYAHYFNDSTVYVVFKGKFFVLPKERDASWDAMIAFGKTVGVGPEYTESIPLLRARLLG
jgi:hypothetical protein